MTQPDFGTDWSCPLGQGLDPSGTMTSGVALVAQALLRRISTPNGRSAWDPDYGYMLLGEIDDDIRVPADTSRIAASVDTEFEKDPRVSSSKTTCVWQRIGNSGGGQLVATSFIVTSAGPFRLVLGVSGVTLQLLEGTTPGLAAIASPASASPAPTPVQGNAGPPGPPGPTGATGAPGTGNLAILVSLGPASTSSAARVPSGAVVTSVIVQVSTPFSGGSAPTVSVSANSQSIFASVDADLTTAGTYSLIESVTIASSAPVVVSFGGTATAGAATVIVLYSSVVS